MISTKEFQLANASTVAQELLVVRLNRARHNGDLENYLKRFGPLATHAELGNESNASVKIVGGVIMEVYPPVFREGGLCSRAFLLKPVGNANDSKLRFRIVLQLKQSHSAVERVRVGDYMAVHDPKSFCAFKMRTFFVGPSRILLWVHPDFSGQAPKVASETPLVSPVKHKRSVPNGTVVSQATLVTKNIKMAPQKNLAVSPIEKPRVMTRPEMPPPSSWITAIRRPRPQPPNHFPQDDYREARLESINKTGSDHGCRCSCSSVNAHHRGCSGCRSNGCCSGLHDHQIHGSGHCKSSCNCCQQEPSCARHNQCISCCSSISGNHCHHSGHHGRSCEQSSCSRLSCSFRHSHGNRYDSYLSSSRSVSSHCHPSCRCLKPPNSNSGAGHAQHRSAEAPYRKPGPSHESSACLDSCSSERPQWFVSKWVEQTRLQSEVRPFTQESQRAICGDSVVDVLSDDDTFTSISQIVPEEVVVQPEKTTGPSLGKPTKSTNLLLTRESDSDCDSSDTSNLFLQPKKSLLNLHPPNRAKADEVLESVKRPVPQGHDLSKTPAVKEAKTAKRPAPQDTKAPKTANGPAPQDTKAPKTANGPAPQDTNSPKTSKRPAPQDPNASAVKEAKKIKLFTPRDSSWLFDPSKPSHSRQKKSVGSNDMLTKDVEPDQKGQERSMDPNPFLSLDRCSASMGRDDENSGQSKVLDDDSPSSQKDTPKEVLHVATSAPAEIIDTVPPRVDQPTDSDDIISPSQSPQPTKGKDLDYIGGGNLEEQVANSSALEMSHITNLLMEWDSETGSGESNDRDLAAPKTVEDLMKDLCGVTNDPSESASDNACTALSNFQFLQNHEVAESDGNKESSNSLDQQPGAEVDMSSDQCNVVSQTSDEPDETGEAGAQSHMSIEKSRSDEKSECENRVDEEVQPGYVQNVSIEKSPSDEKVECENRGDEEVQPGYVQNVSIEKSRSDEKGGCENRGDEEVQLGYVQNVKEVSEMVNLDIDELAGAISIVTGCPSLMECRAEMSLTFCHPPGVTDPPQTDAGEVQESVPVTPHEQTSVTDGICTYQPEAGNSPSGEAFNPTPNPPDALECSGGQKTPNENPTNQHSSQSDLNLQLTSQTSGSGPADQAKPRLSDSRCLTPDSTTKGLSQEWLNPPVSPSSTVFYDAVEDDEGVMAVSRANEEEQMEKQQDLPQFEEGVSNGVVSLRDFRTGLQGEIVDMVPRITEDSYLNIVKGICRLGCESSFNYEGVMREPTMNKSCSHCTTRAHHICPSCREKKIKKPLCLVFDFELHISVGKNILRLRVDDEEATNFLGVSVKHYLRKAGASKDVIRQLKLFSSVDLEEDKPHFRGHFYFKTSEHNDVLIPILVNTSISDFRLTMRASL